MTGLAPAIIVSRLHKQFDGQPAAAIADVSLSMRRGAITGLVGPDGAGKTTLLRLMMGLLRPSSGSIRLNGWDPVTEIGNLHAHVGYMPQKFGLYEDLSVQENLQLYADLRQLSPTERAHSFERLLALTDLQRFTGRPAGKLSGGMKQKLGLACTLLGKPEVLLLDEPGVGVDPISRRELWKLVRELAGDGMTVVWSTAYLDEAELCDDVCLMNEGRLLAQDSPHNLMAAMRGRCVQISGIDGAGGVRRKVLKQALQQPEVIDGVIQGQHVRLVLRECDSVLDLARLGDPARLAMVPVEARLEDAFISLLGGGPGGESALAAVMPHLPDNPEFAGHIIEARALCKRFGDFVATDQVSFKVRQGEIFGLLGPNGAGKSTTFKMECGLLKPTSGQALVLGWDLKNSPTQARQRLGYMAQKFALYGQLTVAQNLEFFSGIYGLRGQSQRRKIEQMIAVFALQPYLSSFAETLPLGFKQRLALACSVMHEPSVLFLDEPTSGVDPVTRREFWTHINGLADKGVTVLVTTHFMDEAEYCDRIALINRGKMLALGAPDQLKQRVASQHNSNPTMEDAFIQLVLESEA